MAVVTSGVLLAISHRLARQILVEEIQSKVLSIAATAGALMDGDLHRQLARPEDQNSAAYTQLEAEFRRVRDANRRDDIFIRYVYSLVPTDKYESEIAYVVDAEEAGSGDKSDLGDVCEAKPGTMQVLDISAYQIDEMVEDDFGLWLSANAPIYDHAGEPVAALGVDFAAHDVLAKTNALLWSGLAAMGVAVGLAVGLSLFLSRHVSRPLDRLADTVKQIGRGDLNAQARLTANDEFGEMSDAIDGMTAGLRERELLKGVLTRYLSYQVAEKVIRSGVVPELKGERRPITVLFLDIREFTAMADRMSSEEVVALLNEFFERMIDVIFQGQGTLDKFTGDGLMALYGAPLEDAGQAEHAVEAAVRMQVEMRKLVARWEEQGRHRSLFSMGIGINSGAATVGNIGSTQRMDYTAIGDTVNLASRLETATKEFDVDILISESTYQAVKGKFKTKSLGKISVKGRADPVSVYAVLDHVEGGAGGG